MREFNLDLLIGKKVAINCKTKDEEEEFLQYLDKKGIKWYGGDSIFKYTHYFYDDYKSRTCFTLGNNGMLQYSPIEYFQELKEYKILSLYDILIKPKNNFKDYGFEAYFEGEILKEVDGFYIGWASVLGYGVDSCKWSKSGNTKYSVYKLKPIKKEWYKAESNFEAYKGKLIINKYGNVRRIQSIDKSKVSTAEQNMYHDILKVDEWRPLTKEEILTLLIKED